MPRANLKIVVGSRVSATMRYLRLAAFASATLPVDINAPGIRFEGNVTGMYKDGPIDYCNVTFDVLPDVSITLQVTCLRYRDTAPCRRRQVQQQQQQPIVTDESPDLLDDAIQTISPMERDNESNDETVDFNWAQSQHWEQCNISIDQRLARPDTSYQYINPSLLALSGAGETPAQFFLHFLPCDQIQSVVIPAINYHARQLNASWIDLDWPEYLTWIMLLVIMTVVNCHDKRMYWRKSNSPFHINVDFTDFMEMSRFNDISKIHMFVVPNGELSILATVKRLTEPWYHSGRVIIADSWFGSPEMARKLMEVGLHSIMQVSKRFYWRKVPGEHLFVSAFRDLKVKALVSTCSRTTNGNIRRFVDPVRKELVEVARPRVFDEYETSKVGKEKYIQNRRDNLINFHDVMRTYCRELRCLSFCLGVTEANAFSAFKFFSVGGNDVGHSEFRWRLAEALKYHVKDLQENAGYAQIRTRSHDPWANGHSLVSMGTNSQGARVT
ncbi:hypothetical protein INT47_012160 [Mucor saturninus]|uniref:PiggyBac transposable element-derived protein domain-containing protein n=1 Tax=Mucor saturninus TaxID=64648 RepID=A0A8H7QE04_9FUNG|nr:hypothetical protein INT47_012160 [Mucor saturninus]